MNLLNQEPDKLTVLALGGNAIIQKGEKGDIHQQFANTRNSMKHVAELVKDGYKFLITHGNGPQVGNIMLMVDKAQELVPETPLGIADAMTSGSMGYMIEQCLQDMMIQQGFLKNVVTIPAQVIVDKNDPALENPTKPIGPFYTEDQAAALREEKGWVVKEDAGRGYRRYVPSPYPIDIVEKDAVKLLLENDYIVITGGGGGIPVFYTEERTLEGIDCVIDKDLASMKLALAVGAKTLVIITGVPKVAINFGKPDQKELETMTLAQARYYYEEGQFPKGSMGPKIMAAIEFVQADPVNKVIITDVASLKEALEGRAGTTIKAY
jgi:carbamate kinase